MKLEFKKIKTNKVKYVLCKILMILLVFFGLFMIFGTIWTKEVYGDMPADQLLITFISPTVDSDMVDYSEIIKGPIFKSLIFTLILSCFLVPNFIIKKKKKIVFDIFKHKVVNTILVLAIFFGGLIFAINKFGVMSIYRAYFEGSKVIDDNYVDPRDANIRFPDKKRNLIHIYLESMENSYMSKELGGFMDVNLIPELSSILNEGYSFSHLNNLAGGPMPTVGTTWSVASMVNMATGLPMKTPTKRNAYGTKDKFLSGAYAIGDILKKEGYNQTIMFGANADFGGLTYYFNTHGDYKIMDYKYAKENNLIPKDYHVWWGYEDDKLFEFAKEELTRLGNEKKPFHFMMETADTHYPDGYLSKNAEEIYDSPYANVLRYNSKEVYKFLKWIQKQPFYENTTVILIGDHLSMETKFFKHYKFDEDFKRSQYNVILNPSDKVKNSKKEIFYNRKYANFDMFPTILSSIGVEYDGNRLGIGTDLFSGKKTIFEELGYDYVNKELEYKSKLYNDKILKK